MLKQESKIKKEEDMNSMYKKGGKTSKKKVMKEARKEGESFMEESKEIGFDAPGVKPPTRKFDLGGLMDKKPKEEPVKTETNTNLFGRTTNYTQTGKDTDNKFTETVTNRKGRVVKETAGDYKEKAGDIVKNNETVKKFNKEGNVRKEVTSNFETTPGRGYGFNLSKVVSKNGEKVRERSQTYKENPKETINKGKVTNYKRGTERFFDRGTSNINEGKKLGGMVETGMDVVARGNRAEGEATMAGKKKMGGKYKKGGFPDLNGDNEITFGDILKGRLKGKTPEEKKMGGMYKKGGKKTMEPGGGGRFAAMVKGLKSKGKSEESAEAIAASVGRKKYGKSKFQAMAAAGKKKMGGKMC